MSRYALLIGIGEYEDKKFIKLRTPKSDVERFGKVLRDERICDFDSVEVLIDQPEPKLRRSIARFFKDKKPDDLLLFYFSGHGVKDGLGDLYFATTDTEMDVLSASSVAASFVNKEMNDSFSRSQLIILDCCYSGAFSGSKSSLGVNVGIDSVFDVSGFGKVILTATDSTQLAWEGSEVFGETNNSIFTSHLIYGLESGDSDLNNDGIITVDELYQYIFSKVVQDGGKQKPQKYAAAVEGGIIVALNPNLPKSTGAKPKISNAIGTYEVKLLEKGTIEFPVLLRSKSDLYLTQGFDKNLMLMNASMFEMILERITSVSLLDPMARLLRRLILSNAYQVRLNKLNRVRIPELSLTFLGGGDSLILVGNGEYFEIWAKNDWMNSKEEIMRNAVDLGKLLKSTLKFSSSKKWKKYATAKYLKLTRMKR